MEQCREIEKRSPFNLIMDYEEIKHNLIIRPLNYEKNEKKLEAGVYELIGDIALTLYVNIGNIDGLYTSAMVPSITLGYWEKSINQVIEDAKKNTYILFPPRLFNWLDIGRFEDEDYGIFMERDPDVKLDRGSCATFVTTKNQLNGAVAMFMPGVAKRLGDLIGSDFFLHRIYQYARGSDS